MDSRSEHFYIRVLQLAAKLIPQSAVDSVTGEKRNVTLQLKFAERKLIRSEEIGLSLEAPPSGECPAVAPINRWDSVDAQQLIDTVRTGDPESEAVKALKSLIEETAKKLVDRREKRRREREEERAEELKLHAEERRARMYVEGRWHNLSGRFNEWDN